MSFLQNIGTTEIVIVSIIIVVLFGGKKIPELIKGMAEGVREFKKDSKK